MEPYKQIRKVLLVVCCTVAVTTLAHAQMSEAEKSFWRRNFLGWNGIAARCEGSDFPYADRICERVSKEAEFLTATARIPFVYTGRSKSFDHYTAISRAGLKHPLELSIYIFGTEGHLSVGVYGRLEAGTAYSSAIDDGALKKEPGYRPKSGDFVIWKRDVVGNGQPKELAEKISNALKDHLKSLITLYVKFRKPIE